MKRFIILILIALYSWGYHNGIAQNIFKIRNSGNVTQSLSSPITLNDDSKDDNKDDNKDDSNDFGHRKVITVHTYTTS